MPGCAYAVAERRCWVCEREGEAPARAVGSRVVSSVFCVPRVAAAVRTSDIVRRRSRGVRIIMGSDACKNTVRLTSNHEPSAHSYICDVYTTSHIFRSFIIHLHHLAPPLLLAPPKPHLSCRASTHTDSAMCLVLAVQTGRTLRYTSRRIAERGVSGVGVETGSCPPVYP